jgi:hypothetical protein
MDARTRFSNHRSPRHRSFIDCDSRLLANAVVALICRLPLASGRWPRGCQGGGMRKSSKVMRRSATPLFLFILALSSPICCQDGWTQDTPAADSTALPKAVLDRLPSAYREKAGELLKATDPLRSTGWVQEYLRTASDEELTGWMIENLATKPAD